MTRLSAAFVPLNDAAILIVAHALGFASDEGVDLVLVRDTSWANVRDRLVYGQVQAAHIPAPLAVAVTLGLGQLDTRLIAPFKLGMNGTAFTASPQFAAALDPNPKRRIDDPVATAHDIANAIGLHHRKPVFGIVHRFSSMALLLRYWLASAGIDPDSDVALRVLPPSLMGEALANGEIDAFFAGEPWNTAAIASGAGELVATSAALWQKGLEKVLALREDWAASNPATLDALIRALDRAASWCDDPANHDELAELLAQPEYLGQSAELIRPGLAGVMPLSRGSQPVSLRDFMIFHREAANFPWRSQGLWIYSQLVRWAMVDPSEEAAQTASGVFRSDIYRRAMAGTTTAMPGASSKVEGALSAPLAVGSARGPLTLGPDRFFDGREFDPNHVDAYIAALHKEIG